MVHYQKLVDFFRSSVRRRSSDIVAHASCQAEHNTPLVLIICITFGFVNSPGRLSQNSISVTALPEENGLEYTYAVHSRYQTRRRQISFLCSREHIACSPCQMFIYTVLATQHRKRFGKIIAMGANMLLIIDVNASTPRNTIKHV